MRRWGIQPWFRCVASFGVYGQLEVAFKYLGEFIEEICIFFRGTRALAVGLAFMLVKAQSWWCAQSVSTPPLAAYSGILKEVYFRRHVIV